jgi:hypothetical protein
MLEADPSLARLRFWGELLRIPTFASLGVLAVGIVLTIVFDLSWLYLVIGGALAWFLFARLAVKVWRDFHLADLDWRLEHGSRRERTLLALAQRAVWNWPDEVPADATHAVIVIEEVGGELHVERFCGLAEAEERAARRIDALAGESEAVAVGVVELDAPEERALIEVVNGKLASRRDLKSLEPAEDGWLVGI